VISNFTGHSAIDARRNDNTWGPSFVSLAEGFFCNTCSRKVSRLCSHPRNPLSPASGSFTGSRWNASHINETAACFDLDTYALHEHIGGRRIAIQDEPGQTTTFTEVFDWS
jgi:hypothetical protein